MSLRVLHILDHSSPLHSGYVFRTLAILREQRRIGWETFHLTSPKQTDARKPVEEVDGWSFFRTLPPLPRTPLPLVSEWRLVRALERRIAEIAADVKPDILHAHSPVLNAIPALRVGARMGLPVVYEVRAFWEDAAVDHGTARENGLRYRATRLLETQALRRARHVVTICEGLKQDIVGRGLPENRVTVVPNAVDVDAFRYQDAPDAALKARLGLTDALVIGFIGSFYAYEGLDLLIAAMPDVLKTHPTARLLLVGGGNEEAALREQARALSIADKVLFAGRVPHDDVPRYYSVVDILVYPRRPMRLTELVTPLKPLEAMAQGRVLIASDVGGHRELIGDGQTGTLFKAGDAAALARAIVTRLADRAEGDRMCRAGRAFVESQRNWPASVGRYRSVYAGLVGAAR